MEFFFCFFTSGCDWKNEFCKYPKHAVIHKNVSHEKLHALCQAKIATLTRRIDTLENVIKNNVFVLFFSKLILYNVNLIKIKKIIFACTSEKFEEKYRKQQEKINRQGKMIETLPF